MTTDLGCSKRSFVGTLVLGLFAFNVSTQGGEIRWQPVATDGDIVCMPGSGGCGDTEIKLASGGATVTLFLEVSAWDTADGGHPGDRDYFLVAVQGIVDHTGYAGPHQCNLNPVGAPGMGYEGAFNAWKVCTNSPYGCGDQDLLSVCRSDRHCEAGQSCMERCDHVFYQLDPSLSVSTATIDYGWSCVSHNCREDPRDGTRFYAGTLLLEVPPCAQGTYTINFYDDPNFTIFNRCPGFALPGPVLKPAEITIEARAPIPTVSEWGLIGMTLLALTAGTILFGRRRSVAA